ncbi:tautomerase family protein [Rhizobium sp. SIMBA_035]
MEISSSCPPLLSSNKTSIPQCQCVAVWEFLLLEITSRPRSRDAKVAFYASLTSALQARCNVPPSDVMVSLSTNSDEDWSFGMGDAQFLTGELR